MLYVVKPKSRSKTRLLKKLLGLRPPKKDTVNFVSKFKVRLNVFFCMYILWQTGKSLFERAYELTNQIYMPLKTISPIHYIL